MTEKEKISIVRSDDFTTVDAELSNAIEQLDKSNARIVDLLATDNTEISDEPDDLSPTDPDKDAQAEDSKENPVDTEAKFDIE